MGEYLIEANSLIKEYKVKNTKMEIFSKDYSRGRWFPFCPGNCFRSIFTLRACYPFLDGCHLHPCIMSQFFFSWERPWTAFLRTRRFCGWATFCCL